MKSAVANFYWAQLAGAQRVLDLGCGAGEIGSLSPKGREVHGLDIGIGRGTSPKGYASAVMWDLDEDAPLPFADHYFDAIIAKDILEHLRCPWKTVAEIRRVLRPGGLVLASLICYRGRRLWSDYTHVRGFTEDSARRLFSDVGFIVEDQWRMGPVPGSARLNAIKFVPSLLAFPVFDWLWTSSYELRARSPNSPNAG